MEINLQLASDQILELEPKITANQLPSFKSPLIIYLVSRGNLAYMAPTKNYDSHLKCSFCGKSQEQVRKLIAGPGVYICDECVELCNEILDEELLDPNGPIPHPPAKTEPPRKRRESVPMILSQMPKPFRKNVLPKSRR